MALFDELALAKRSESNPLKVFHHKLEYTGKDEGISFVGISNYSLVNRALILSIQENNDKDFYDKLRYILYKEIIKISDINYRFKIFKKLIESNEMIKKIK